MILKSRKNKPKILKKKVRQTFKQRLQKLKVTNQLNVSYKKYKESMKHSKVIEEKLKALELNINVLKEDFGKGTINDQLDHLETENNKLKDSNAEMESSVQYLETVLADSDSSDRNLVLFDKMKREYTNDAVKCIMNLTDLKVASKKVLPVINEVATMCGKVPNKLPSRPTVDSIVDRKVSIAKKQLACEVKDKPNTTLYTDETCKYGTTMQSYIITDEKQNSLVMGLREMFNKNGTCTLDTFREIIHDINSM